MKKNKKNRKKGLAEKFSKSLGKHGFAIIELKINMDEIVNGESSITIKLAARQN